MSPPPPYFHSLLWIVSCLMIFIFLLENSTDDQPTLSLHMHPITHVYDQKLYSNPSTRDPLDSTPVIYPSNDDPTPATTTPECRYPFRNRRPPDRLSYVRPSFCPSFQCILAAIHSYHEPQPYDEVVQIPQR